MSAADENWQVLALHIEAALPQTQCTRCGYPDCAGYARAIAQGQAAINQCPPGGEEGVRRLAALTGQPPLSLNPEHGSEGPRSVAVIDEAWCIGCTLCLAPCPTDAILGANKQLHTVMGEHCTGCGLCVPVCPVDCIQLQTVSGTATGWQAWSTAQAQQAQARYRQHQQRWGGGAAPTPEASALPKTAVLPAANPPLDKKAAIAAALAKARARRTG
ncbi:MULTISPECIES: RnfABCDGE type electron transport complex subunit B [Giesbergeria]|uniref:RnfABCDGE type electron transport complex subunit B n=1 Tax=Giesbergeria sinuosa TaxID=80883 RepID=A0ABV9QBY7_9BURK